VIALAAFSLAAAFRSETKTASTVADRHPLAERHTKNFVNVRSRPVNRKTSTLGEYFYFLARSGHRPQSCCLFEMERRCGA